jgi:sulfate permease, SulP family
MAGLTVAVVALPLAMAFAIASGLPPQAGLMTAVIGGLIISALGGSRVQIGGPAGAYIVVVYAIVQKHGIPALLVATLMAGGILFVMGWFRLGQWVRYVPVTIVIGFTNGIAVVIAFAQVKDALGLAVTTLPSDFVTKLTTLGSALHTTHGPTLMMTVATLGVVVGWSKLATAPSLPPWLTRLAMAIPAPVIGLVLATLYVALAQPPVATIGERFGGIPAAFPQWTELPLSWLTAKEMIPAAFTLAGLGAIESLLCARIADGVINDRHDPNQELMAQGLANIASPLFGGYVATGTIARTLTNVRAGARTPIAGIIHSLAVLAFVWILAPVAVHIPMAALAAILLIVAYNMGEWREFQRLFQFSYFYRITLLTTFVLTVVIDLTLAFQAGLALACIFFISRMASLTRLERVELPNGQSRSNLDVFQLSGALFFGSIGKLDSLLNPRRQVEPITLLDLSHLTSLDNTGLEALESLQRLIARNSGVLAVVGLNGQPRELALRGGWLAALGPENDFPELTKAIDTLTNRLK